MTFGRHKIRASLLALIMITSVMAVGGLGSAAVQSSNLDLTDDSPTAGGQTQVTLEATANNGSSKTQWR
jgi:surface glycoprotein (TIGR04207 family)